MTIKQRFVLILLLTLVALIIRLWGADFGLPYAYHIDEHFYYPYAWAMGQGQLKLPDQSHGPSLYLATLLLGQQIIHAQSFNQLSTAEFGALLETNPWPFLLSARVISALAGALTIPFVYLMGRRYRNNQTGLVAAALMAVIFFHVRDSHFGVPDSFMTLFVAMSSWLALRAHQTARRIDFWLAGLCAGLATASKYTSAFIFVPVMLAAFNIQTSDLQSRLSRFRIPRPAAYGLYAVFGLLIGFIVGYPNILINFQAFIKDINFLSARIAAGFEGWQIGPDSSALFYLGTFTWSIGLPLTILSVIGLSAALLRRKPGDLIVASFPVIYFIAMSLSRGHFGRYLIPLLPFLVILAVDVCLTAWPAFFQRFRPLPFIRRPSFLGWIALLLILVPNTANSLRADWLLNQSDTRTLAKQWIETNIGSGARIAIEWPYHTPPLSNGYAVPPGSAREYWTDLVYGFGLADRPLQQYQTDGTQFIIATSYIAAIPVIDPQREESRRRFYAELPKVFHEIKTFSPRCDGGKPEFIFDQIYGPAVDLWNLCYAGPLIRIYQVNHS